MAASSKEDKPLYPMAITITPNGKKRKGKKKMWLILGAVLLGFVIIIWVFFPPSFGRPRPVLDDSGNAAAGSISEKLFVDVNGTSLGMVITAKDATKPVLLFLGGGPGIPQYLLEYMYPTGIENEFVVCYLEYRGTSLSYQPGMPADDLTIEQYVSDVAEVTHYLRKRFGQEKIYLIGHSFGTYVALNTVGKHPELYHAYIAMSQMVDQKQSEIMAYDYMLAQYRAQGNNNMARRLLEYPIAESEEMYREYAKFLRDEAMHDSGVGTARDMRSVIADLFFPSLRCTAYTQAERINIWRGKSFAQTSPVAQGVRSLNALAEFPKIDVPIYFLAGVYDYTVCYSLQKEYYEQVGAPLKAFYTFHNSAHSPLYEEPDKAMEILLRDVLAGEKALTD